MGHVKIRTIRWAAFAVICSLGLYCQQYVSADLIPNRSLSTASVVASAVNNHTVSFEFPSTASVGSVVFQYCTNPVEGVVCVTPAGLDTSTATLGAQSGETGFSILSQNTNSITITRPSAATGIQLNSYTFNGVTNPNSIGTFYLRINAYASTDGTGPKQDYGATAAVITQGISITAEVPPYLEFCVGVAIPDKCDSASGNLLKLGILRSTRAAAGTTQFSVGTNAEFGYVVVVLGTTMTSGTHIINSLASPTASAPGNPQFGLNLVANTNPPVGANPGGGSGLPSANYGISNRYLFNDGDVVAGSFSVSEFETYTVSYMVNVPQTQHPGIYNTTLTYLCTATF